MTDRHRELAAAAGSVAGSSRASPLESRCGRVLPIRRNGRQPDRGLWDGDDTVGLRGFADRLAEIVDAHYPGLTYANLAVRGRRIRDLLDDQLPEALGVMEPDLVTVCIGMNDATRPGPNFDSALAELEDLYAQLALSGATVVTTTFPDLAQIIPIGRTPRGAWCCGSTTRSERPPTGTTSG